MNENLEHQVAQERAQRANERKELKLATLLARRSHRKKSKLARLGASNLRATKTVLGGLRSAPIESSASTTPAEAEEEISTTSNRAAEAFSERANFLIASHLSDYLAEYLKAEEVVRKATDRLIALRGTQDALTPDDRDVLDNMRDILSARQSKYLEV